MGQFCPRLGVEFSFVPLVSEAGSLAGSPRLHGGTFMFGPKAPRPPDFETLASFLLHSLLLQTPVICFVVSSSCIYWLPTSHCETPSDGMSTTPSAVQPPQWLCSHPNLKYHRSKLSQRTECFPGARHSAKGFM